MLFNINTIHCMNHGIMRKDKEYHVEVNLPSHNAQLNVHYILHTEHCTLNNAHCTSTLHTTHCTMQMSSLTEYSREFLAEATEGVAL